MKEVTLKLIAENLGISATRVFKALKNCRDVSKNKSSQFSPITKTLETCIVECDSTP